MTGGWSQQSTIPLPEDPDVVVVRDHRHVVFGLWSGILCKVIFFPVVAPGQILIRKRTA